MLRQRCILFLILLLCPLLTVAQQGKLRGIISDKITGEPLPAATIIIHNITIETSSDIDGEYVLLEIRIGAIIHQRMK